jgi:predicted RecA/RadA family phage recombinase
MRTTHAGLASRLPSHVFLPTTASAQSAALSGVNVEAAVAGVFDLAKASAQAWAVGNLIYWDNAAKNCTTTATSNKLIGVATAVGQNPSSTGRVRLNGSFS